MQNHRTDHRTLQTGCGCTFLSIHHPLPSCPSRFQCVLISVLSQASCMALQLSSGFCFFFFLRKCSRNLWPDTSLHLNHNIEWVETQDSLADTSSQGGKGKVCAGSKLQRERKEIQPHMLARRVSCISALLGHPPAITKSLLRSQG